MIANNEDISAELDRVVCRLMKLTLRTARRRQHSLSNRWMQYKLLDLLTLTEKAIEKKRQLFAEINPLKAICYDNIEPKPEVDLEKIKCDETANEIVDKYQYLVRSSVEKTNTSEENRDRFYDVLEDDFNDFLNENASMELTFEDIIRSPSLVDIEPVNSMYPRKQFFNPNETPLSRTKAWIDEDVNVIVYSQNSAHAISSGDTDHSASNVARYKNQKISKKRKRSSDGNTNLDVKHRKTQSKTTHGKRKKSKKNDDNSQNRGKTNTITVKKKSNYNIIIKTSSKKLSAVDFGNYFLKAKKSLKHHTHHSCSRPISQTLMEFCQPESERNEYNLSIQESIEAQNNVRCIAATKESLLIDIVMEDKEETIAFRRTIGTGADDDPIMTECEQDNMHGSMTNIIELDSFCNKVDSGFENVRSQTLFLYDINEPSTSKGVRHVSMDVQCGPEANQKYAMLSTTTSLAKMPTIFNNGLKIEESVSDVRRNIKNCDFGTCTNENYNPFNTLRPRERFTGIKIKDSETKITDKVDSGTMTQEGDQEMPSIPNSSVLSSTETRMLKPIFSGLKVEDSGSELCDSLSSSQRSPLHFMKYAKDTNKDNVVEHKFSRKYTRPKLSNGGVYVHSYKERQLNEDVIYQGEWQKYTPVRPKNKIYNGVIKKTPEIRVKGSFKENESVSKTVKSKMVKHPPPKNSNLNNVKQVKHINQEKKTPTLNNASKVANCNRNAKTTPKFIAKAVLPKKSTHLMKRPSVISTALKKDSEGVKKLRKKSYIPLYLKRKLSKYNQDILCSESATEKSFIESNKIRVNIDEEIKETLLKFKPEPQENISFAVFQNEIQSNKHNISCTSDCKSPVNTENATDKGDDDSNKRSPSSQSLNSSAGSSPNSVATVRVRPTLKLCDRRHSSSPNGSNLANNQTRNAFARTNEISRKHKSAKRFQDKVSDNKENIAETSRNSKGSVNKNITFSKNRNIFRAQIATDNPQSTSKNVTKRKSTNKSNIKIPSIPSSTGTGAKQSTSGTSSKPSVTKQRSIKSRASLSPENKSIKDSITSDIAAIPMSQGPDIEKNNVIINIVDNNLLTEWLNSTQSSVVETNTSSILSAMRQLVEERLDFIEKMSDISAEIDSRTIAISEKCDSLPVSDTTSFHDATSLNSSYGTVMGFDDFDYSQIMDFDNSFFDSVVYNEFDPVLGTDSTIGNADIKPDVTELDVLSFNSITTASKMSEYFLAQSSLNNVPDAPNVHILTNNSVRDIFERKPPLSIQSPAGPLAVQAFSGLSMNSAPLTGDQPDHVNLVDSETGSVAHQYARQANSEEVFISGRSSDSFESCLIDEDAVVPNWLFHIISQQQSVQEEDEDEEEESEDFAEQSPLAEPIYDINGNAAEPGMGAGAGAGDGRGIHSDHSQDSSGRGTSLSSSASSSGPHSEAILIDPTAFTTQFDLIREPGSSSVLVPLLPIRMETADTSHVTVESTRTSRSPAILNSSGDPQIVPAQVTSDVDADISSTDTDLPDSSDN